MTDRIWNNIYFYLSFFLFGHHFEMSKCHAHFGIHIETNESFVFIKSFGFLRQQMECYFSTEFINDNRSVFLISSGVHMLLMWNSQSAFAPVTTYYCWCSCVMRVRMCVCCSSCYQRQTASMENVLCDQIMIIFLVTFKNKYTTTFAKCFLIHLLNSVAESAKERKPLREEKPTP